MKHLTKIIACSVIALAALGVNAFATGQAEGEDAMFPDKPVRIVVSFGAGGSNDVLARIVAKQAEEYLGEEVILENHPGGGQSLGQIEAWNAPADGYTLLTINPGIIQNPILRDVPFEYDGWEPLIVYNLDPEVFAVRADAPWDTFEELIEASKVQPITVAVPGNLTNPHICGLYVEQQTGAQFEFVYGESGAEEVIQLLGGHVDSVINTIGAVHSAVGEGQVKLLGVMGEELTPTIREVAPDAQTFYELGYDVGYWAWRGLGVKAGVPADVLATLREAFSDAAKDPRTKQAFEDAGFEVVIKEDDELTEFVEYQNEYMSALLGNM